MRIALIHYSALPVLGGVEIVLDAQARRFADHGHTVTIIATRGESPDPRIPFYRLRPAGSDTGTQDRFAELQPLLGSFDVVIMHNVCTMHFDMALTAALWELTNAFQQVRFICWIHDIAACNPDYQLPALTEEPWSLLARAHPNWTYVAVSEIRARQWSDLVQVAGNTLRVIPNGLEPEQVLGLTPTVSALARKHHLLERDLVLVHPTRLLYRKNVELGLHVTHALRSEGTDAVYLVTAPPDAQNSASLAYGEMLRELRTKLGLDQYVLFLNHGPRLNSRDIASIYGVADALFFPSRQEGFGLPVLEAALYRLPAFCADIEPLRDLPGAIPFSLNTPPNVIAAAIIQYFNSPSANFSRKQVTRTYSWPAIYQKLLAPLLEDPNTPVPDP